MTFWAGGCAVSSGRAKKNKHPSRTLDGSFQKKIDDRVPLYCRLASDYSSAETKRPTRSSRNVRIRTRSHSATILSQPFRTLGRRRIIIFPLFETIAAYYALLIILQKFSVHTQKKKPELSIDCNGFELIGIPRDAPERLSHTENDPFFKSILRHFQGLSARMGSFPIRILPGGGIGERLCQSHEKAGTTLQFDLLDISMSLRLDCNILHRIRTPAGDGMRNCGRWARV